MTQKPSSEEEASPDGVPSNPPMINTSDPHGLFSNPIPRLPDLDDGEADWSDEELNRIRTSFRSTNADGEEEGEQSTQAGPKGDLRDMFSDNEDDSELLFNVEFEDDDVNRGSSKKKSRGGSKPIAERELSSQVKQFLSLAYKEYVSKDYNAAITLAEEAIRHDPDAQKAYNLLAAIYEALGDFQKVLTAKTYAMQLDKKDKDGWIELAEMSRDRELYEQAIRFYQIAYRLDPNDLFIIREIADLYVLCNKYNRAIPHYQMLRKIFPQDKNLMQNLAGALVKHGRPGEAAKLYEDLLRANQNKANEEDRDNADDDDDDNDDNSTGPVALFEWSELNILADIYTEQKAWSKAIKIIKSTARWLQGRGNEIWWDSVKDDSEFDNRRFTYKQHSQDEKMDQEARYSLPIDIRMKLLVYRLKLDQPEEALIHLQYLKDLDPYDFNDLYISIGKSLQVAGLVREALQLFVAVQNCAQFIDLELTLTIGKCEAELGYLEDAESTYKSVIDQDKKNIEAHVGLAEIYGFTCRTPEARELLKKVAVLRKEKAEEEKEAAKNEAKAVNKEMIIPDKSAGKAVRKYAPTKAERIAAEKRAEELVVEKYRDIQRLSPGLENGNIASVMEWLRVASELVDMFSSVKKLFPNDKSKVFTGLGAATKRSRNMDIEDRIGRLTTRLLETEIGEKLKGDRNKNRQFLT